ncbi:unnamed protein product, partial [Mesorhabditis spiculigera]
MYAFVRNFQRCPGPLLRPSSAKILPARKPKEKPTTRCLAEYVVPLKVSTECTPSTNTPPKTAPAQRKAQTKKATPLKKKLTVLREVASADVGQKDIPPHLLPSELALDALAHDLLKQLKKFQDRLAAKSEEKSHAHRRYVAGFHESLKKVRVDDAKLVILARNVDAEMNEVLPNSPLFDLRSECKNRRVPLIEASTKRGLTRALAKFPYTNCVGVLDYSGVEHIFHQLLLHAETVRVEKIVQNNVDQASLFA